MLIADDNPLNRELLYNALVPEGMDVAVASDGTGVLEIVAAIRYADEMEHEWLMGLAGLASVLFGLAVAVFPAAGLLAILWLIGAYAIVFGILMLIAGLRARGHATTPTMRPA